MTRYIDVGLLFLRVSAGGFMLMGHGLGKLMNFSMLSTQFPDPIGMGPLLSLVLAIFAEAVCALLVVLGVATRLAVIPLIITMLVAAVIVHSDDPWGKKEFALMYAIPFLTLLLTGGGKFSLGKNCKYTGKYV